MHIDSEHVADGHDHEHAHTHEHTHAHTHDHEHPHTDPAVPRHTALGWEGP